MARTLYSVGDIVRHRTSSYATPGLVRVLEIDVRDPDGEIYLVAPVDDVEMATWTSEVVLLSIDYDDNAEMVRWIGSIEDKIDRLLLHLGVKGD